jgi:AraC-like DNA-binding protein
MFLSVVAVLVFLLNVTLVFLNIRRENTLFQRHLMIILALGLFQILFGFLCNHLFPEWLYLLLIFPNGLLYGPALALLAHDLIAGPAVFGLWKHMFPFFGGMLIFIILCSNFTIRYRYNLDYSIFLNFLSYIHLLGYMVWLWFGMQKRRSQFLKFNLKRIIFFASIIVSVFWSSFLIFRMAYFDVNFNIHRGFSMGFYVLFLSAIQFVVPPNSKLIQTEVSKASKVSVIPQRIRELDMMMPLEKQKGKLSIPPMSKEKQVEYRKAIDYFIQTLAYLDSDLNKESFCQQVGIPVHQVGAFLKDEFDKGLNGFINQLRLSYAAKQLRSEELVYTISDLAFVCGFNSRASFYRNFQSEFGCSPHQYRMDSLSMVCG